MESHEKRLNWDLIAGWSLIVFVLCVTYFVEVLKGERTIRYLCVFIIVTWLPALVCTIMYRKDPLNSKLRYYIVAGYFVMYFFVMASGNTTLVFVYILPMLSLLILYHQPNLIATTGLATMALNFYFIYRRAKAHEINMNNSKDVEIQVALLILCFTGSFIASRLYDEIHKKNLEYTAMLDEKSKQIQRMTLQTIETIANTLDAKDEYTQGHSRRVSEYAVQIAREMHMDEEETENIKYIALLHDIGKIGVPDYVLNKPGRLTDSEYELMKQHTVTGGEILKDIGLFKDLDVGAKYHHERYDGKGYPNGLKGEEIPLVARIICMADSYDAMTSNRVYRNHLSKEVVMSEIERCRGTQFDPNVADAFLAYLNKIDKQGLTAVKYSDEEHMDDASKLLKKFMRDQTEQTIESINKDELTRVYSRSAGERYITIAMRAEKGCLFLANLDDMRAINRQHGFRRGDYYLKQMVRVFQESVSDIIISRFGGDEFLCYIPGIVNQDEIKAVIDNIYGKLKEYEENDELISKFRISIGITVHDRDEQELQDLLMEADKALYHVKQTTKNNYYFYRQVENLSDNFYKADMCNLIEALKRKDNFSDQTVLEKEDFLRMYEFIKEIALSKKQKVRLIMFTMVSHGAEAPTSDEKEEIMSLVEQAILGMLPDESAISQYSSAQRIVLVTEEEKRDLAKVARNIAADFAAMYDGSDITLEYEIAE
jgi:diguanylate cyclase (GGDEF)-like protein/putative nucleotidyltransferase with HDIG domain